MSDTPLTARMAKRNVQHVAVVSRQARISISHSLGAMVCARKGHMPVRRKMGSRWEVCGRCWKVIASETQGSEAINE